MVLSMFKKKKKKEDKDKDKDEMTKKLQNLTVGQNSPKDRRPSATPPGEVNQARRRLSVMAGGVPKTHRIDGAAETVEEKSSDKSASNDVTSKVIGKTASITKTGYVPFNPNKVNQDRFCEIINFGQDENKALFGVFDGHGAKGHEVSQFVATELPQHILSQKELDENPVECITKAFLDCNAVLATSSKIDCTFSGTTAVCVYMQGKKIYSCNAGDSRAVLGKCVNGEWQAVALSRDHKPDLADEKKRILASNGRVEACKGADGNTIGPPRVWLQDQDVPGLAMTRSMGDLIAASVGVSSRPEIWEREVEADDKFIVLASDGVWEFCSNLEVISIIAKAKTAEEAAKAVVEESTKRWKKEEEVIDDITAVVCFFPTSASSSAS